MDKERTYGFSTQDKERTCLHLFIRTSLSLSDRLQKNLVG